MPSPQAGSLAGNLLAAILMGLLVAACAPASSGGSPPTLTPARTTGLAPTAAPTAETARSLQSPMPVLNSPSSPTPDPSAAIAAAQADAAGLTGLSAAEIAVAQVEPHEWGDSSLGCPKPDSMYSQIVTPGFLVVVTAAGRTLEYHADSRGHVVLCQER